MAFPARFHGLHRGLAQRHSFCVDFAAEFDHRLDPFPRHTLGPREHGARVVQVGPVPMQFQNAPTALNRIILAVIRRVIEELDGFTDRIDPVHHALEKLGPHATALRTVVHFELHPVNRAVFRGAEALPPRRERIDEEVAGLRGTAEGHMELGGIFIENPTRNIVCRAAKVMVTGFGLTASLPTTRERPNLDSGVTVPAQPFDAWRSLAPLVFFLRLAKIAAVSGSFFWGLALRTLRKP